MLLNLAFLFMFISLTSLGVFLRSKNKENRLVFWVAVISISGGLAGLQILLERGIVPYLTVYGSPQTLQAAEMLTGGLNVYINAFPYYGILVFFLIYNGLMKYDKWVLSLLSLPIWITLLFQSDISANTMNSLFIASWGAVYILVSIGLALRPVLTDKSLAHRLQHTAIALMFLLPELMINAYHFANPRLSDTLLILIPYVCGGSVVLFLLLYLSGSFLGLRRKSVQTLQVSTALIHHSLKNSIGKVKLNALNIQNHLDQQRYDEVHVYVRNLLHTHESMMNTMANIAHSTSDKLTLNQEEHDLYELMETAAEALLAFPRVRVELSGQAQRVLVDKEWIADCLSNIVNNAVEAMKEDGTITFRLEKRRGKVLLSVGDTGPGMNSVQLQNVFEPFYSTKRNSGKHFGLGMYQVKKAMAAHRGKVEITSAPGKGTRTTLIFRANK